MRAVAALVAVVLGAACGGDKDSAAVGSDPPDISGRYNFVVLGVAGCEGDPTWLEGWARGRLEVTGTGSTPSFDFGDGVVFGGFVEGDGGFRFSGSLEQAGASLSVSGEGLAGLAPTDPGDGSQSLLDGELTVVVSQEGQQDCTSNGPFQATELTGVD